MAGSWVADVAIIEDDIHLRNSIKDLLDTAGYSSELFGSADEFLDSQRYRSVGCILADVRMPGTSGIEMLRWLKSQGDCPPVLIMTSYGDQQMHATALKQGASGFLPKPIDTTLLLRIIQEVIESPQL
ncbi:response regulator (plasmid) [Aliirhizobium terrae]|uniref:response regulator transcription factor n=1 Tax=Terrirhizobium terrae TaxID=2926709 RepID=UPI0025786B5D|nr:response regulator [Rhizobium sp. CC-CFT758]WJH37980.1 response regulator [Rhizobium sp. CC-CFT758]